MRLLNTSTLQLESFLGAEIDIPPYAILSHTWTKSEITFDDIQKDLYKLKNDPAFAKIEKSCGRAKIDGFRYIWIDTCCIDKSSSAELSEAINSMFKWYQQSSLCYVFLSDFQAQANPLAYRTVALDENDVSFCDCQWFTRGWTLQELIAPLKVDFFDRNWTKFGSRNGRLLARLCNRTDISRQVFSESRCSCLDAQSTFHVRDGVCTSCQSTDNLPQTLDSFAISIKMSWAADRITTRKEDAAYSLLGLFNINMPMLYGEGERAFSRLQDAITRQSKDQSIFLWRMDPSQIPQDRALGCLAPAVKHFRPSIPIVGRRVFNNLKREEYSADFLGSLAPMKVTDTSLKVNIYLCPCKVITPNPQYRAMDGNSLWLGILDLVWDSDYLTRPAIILEYLGMSNFYRRIYNQIIVAVDPRVTATTLCFSREGVLQDSSENIYKAEDGAPNNIIVKFAIDEANKQDVGILLQQSPKITISMDPRNINGPPLGPLYFIINKDDKFPCEVDVGGSHPPLNRYLAHAAQISTPWDFQRCDHVHERFFGGLHFLNFRFDVNGLSTRVDVAIIWGTHRPNDHAPEQQPWCRIFHSQSFFNNTKWNLARSQLYGEPNALPPVEIQQRMVRQREWLSTTRFAKLCIGDKGLFPSSCERRWENDCLEDILKDNPLAINLSVSVGRRDGLGRSLYELKITLKANERKDTESSLFHFSNHFSELRLS